MKRNYPFILLLIFGISMGACSQSEGSSKGSVSSEQSSSSIESSSSEVSSSSIYTPSIPSREEGISLAAFEEEVNKLDAYTKKPFRITFHLIETVVGTYPIYMKRSQELLPEGVYVTDVVIESADGNPGNVRVIGEGPNTTNQADIITNGVVVDVRSWISYHKQRRSHM